MSALPNSVVVKMAGQPVTFTTFQALEAEAAIQRQAIRQIEEGSLAVNPRDPDAWRRLEARAADLLALLTGMDAWIAAEDAELDREIEAARAAIRALWPQSL